MLSGRVHPRHGGAGCGARPGGCQRLGELHVGRIIAAIGEGDGIFAGVRQHVELVRQAAADGPGRRPNGAEAEAEAGEDRRVGAVHDLVGFLQRGMIDVEGVGVLHQEFACAHDTEARADLVAELGLDLVIAGRQLLVALDLAPDQIGDHLLVRRTEAELALMAVAQAQQLRAVLLPASGFLPQLGGLHDRHQQLQRAGAVHLLAHDVLHLAQHAQPERQPGVEPGGELADQAGTQHELMAHDLGVGRRLLQGGQREAGYTHGGDDLWRIERSA